MAYQIGNRRVGDLLTGRGSGATGTSAGFATGDSVAIIRLIVAGVRRSQCDDDVAKVTFGPVSSQGELGDLQTVTSETKRPRRHRASSSIACG